MNRAWLAHTLETIAQNEMCVWGGVKQEVGGDASDHMAMRQSPVSSGKMFLFLLFFPIVNLYKEPIQ